MCNMCKHFNLICESEISAPVCPLCPVLLFHSLSASTALLTPSPPYVHIPPPSNASEQGLLERCGNEKGKLSTKPKHTRALSLLASFFPLQAGQERKQVFQMAPASAVMTGPPPGNQLQNVLCHYLTDTMCAVHVIASIRDNQLSCGEIVCKGICYA